MVWYIIAGMLMLVAVAMLVIQYVADRRHLRKKTSQAMGDVLWKEIQDEREASKERQEKFRAALDKADDKEQKR